MANSKLMDMVRNKKAALAAASGRREKTVKPQAGKNRFRILPGWNESDRDTFWHDFGQHFIKNVADELQAVYVCTSKTFGRHCEVCSAIAEEVKNNTDDRIIKKLGEATSKGRFLMNALHLDGDDKTTPVILELGVKAFNQILDLIEEYPDLLDLEKGNDLVITRTGKGLNTEYSVMVAAKSNPVEKVILKKLHNLSDYCNQEYAEGQTKAIAAVGNVGILSGPASAKSASGSADKPKSLPPADEMENVLEADYAEVKEERAALTPPVKPAPKELSEDDLDELMKDL